MTELTEAERSEIAAKLAAEGEKEAAVLEHLKDIENTIPPPAEPPPAPPAPEVSPLDALIATYEAQAEQAQKIVAQDDYMLTKLANELEQRRAAQIANQTTLNNLQAVIADLKGLSDADNPAP